MPATATDRIDGLTTSVAVKAPCRVATTANITLSGLQTIASVTLADGDRVLVKDQTSSVNNGIYVVRSTAWERARDFDGARDAVPGTIVVVRGTGSDVIYKTICSDNPVVIGSSTITFALAAFGDSSSVAFLQAGTGAVARTLQDKGRDVVSVADFGAVGDGVTNDTTAWQNALNSGASMVVAIPGKTYLVSQVGTKSILGVSNRYCLLLPPGIIVDLNQATVKLASAQNAAIFLNKNAGTSQDADVTIRNGTLDGNKANQTVPATGEMPCLHLYDCLRPNVQNLVFQNVRQYANRNLKCDKGYWNNLTCLDSDGDGFSFGIDANSRHVTNGFIDNIRAESCTGAYTGGSLVGNPMIFTVQYTHVGKIYGKDCNGGIKCQDSSNDSSFGQVIFRGTNNGTANSGFKVQGNGAGLTPVRISVGQVISENAFGTGLYLAHCTDVNIGSYIGYNSSRGLSAGTRCCEMQVGTDRVTIASVRSISCKTTGAVICVSDGRVQFANVFIYNPTLTAFQITSTSGLTEIGDLVVHDDGGGTTTQCLYMSGSGKGRCQRLATNLSNSVTVARLQIASGNYEFTVDSFQMGTNAQEGNITLSAGGTTVVANNSIMRAYMGGTSDYIHPLIQMMPVNNSARALGAMFASVTDSSSGTGFTINTSTLATTSDKVFWKVLGWKVVSTPFG